MAAKGSMLAGRLATELEGENACNDEDDSAKIDLINQDAMNRQLIALNSSILQMKLPEPNSNYTEAHCSTPQQRTDTGQFHLATVSMQRLPDNWWQKESL